MSDDYIDWEKAARKYNIEIGEKDATIARLKAENAELKKRLAKFEADRMPFEQQTCGRRK